MDEQLQELVDKIKKDGVQAAEKQAADIVAQAEKKAAGIVAAAEARADGIVKNATAETKRLEKASEDAITQAARNMLLSFRDGLVAELDKIVHDETEKAYSSDLLKRLVPETVKAWVSKSEADDISVLLSEDDLKSMESELKAALKAEIAKGLVIKADPTLSKGFRIGVKDGSAFYDYSAEELADMFGRYLNPRVASLMKAASGVDAKKEEN